MKRLILLSFLVFIILSSRAQVFKSITGTWKVIAVNNGVYYNYKTDSMYVTKPFSDSLAGRKDSIETIEMFSSFARQYDDYYFVFDEKGKYREFRAGTLRLEGRYEVNHAHSAIDILVTHNNKEKTIYYRFGFIKSNMRLFVPGPFPETDLELLLEKIK